MRNALTIAGLSLLVAAAPGCTERTDGAAQARAGKLRSRLAFSSDWGSALREAREKARPIVLFFGGPW
ncbi:MAG: hypothetical protein O7J95_03995 [Planctomycetota bacterium]|nr:hypothetical protein [Planctomycetota bacterium]